MIVLAVAQSALATIITLIFKTYLEPLTGKAAFTFAILNFRYFALPMQLILLAFINTLLALVLWISGTYGLMAGLFASSALGVAMWFVLVTFSSVIGWENEKLTKKVRKQREELRERIWKTLFPFNVCPWLK